MTTNTDFAPLFRSSVGFDRVFDLLESSLKVQASTTWPPYDIVREDEDSYRITIAVAGFGPDELSITYEPNLLVVKGSKAESTDSKYLYRGLTNGPFERQFELADYVEVTDARLENGLLSLWLKRELPEAMKPRRIAIGSPGATSIAPPQIEAQRHAA